MTGIYVGNLPPATCCLFLNTGATLARVQSTGKSPVSNHCLNIKCNTGASSLVRLWSNLPGVPSGPEDLLVFIPSINL